MDKKSISRILGDNLRRYREVNHLTQEEFAEKVGISTSFCGALEIGIKAPSVVTLRNLADAMGVTTNDLMYEYCQDDCLENISVLLAGRSPEYIVFIERLIAVCNDSSHNIELTTPSN